MAKSIVVFCDGTGQAGGLLPDETRSNVYKLYRATRCGPDTAIDPASQVAFYDPGLGSKADGEAWWGRVGRGVYNVLAQATGLGITRNIIACYAFILRVWEDGDRIYLVGFSRGAYTARCLGGVLGYCGVPTRGEDGAPLPLDPASTQKLASEAVKRIYQHGSSMRGDPLGPERHRLAQAFRLRHGSGDAGGPNAWPYAIGVFDTVAALGFGRARFWPFVVLCFVVVTTLVRAAGWLTGFIFRLRPVGHAWGWSAAIVIVVACALYALACLRYGGLVSLARYRMAFYDDNLGTGVAFARHALSIDENRADFQRRPWRLAGDPAGVAQQRTTGPEPDRLVQMWFAGVHSDVGGGYAEAEARLSDAALRWMVDELANLPCPVAIDPFYLRLSPSGTGLAHDEVAALCDRLPGPFKRFGWTKGVRDVPDDAPLHASVLTRFEAPAVVAYGCRAPYRPDNLREHRDVSRFYVPAPALTRPGTPAA